MPVALVTGGAGFLGGHMGDALVDAGYEVRLLDRTPPPGPLSPGRTFITADVRDAEAMRRAAAGCDVVIGNAALVPVTRASAEEFRSVNVGGCRTTIEAAREAGAYLVHISSSAIYGAPDGLPVTEESPLKPFEPYGVSKAEAHELVQRERERGLVVSSLAARALLGAGRLGLFEIIFRRISKDRRVPLFGRGDIPLQMCDARDFSAAVLACIERRANGDFNIGASEFGTPRSDLEGLIERVGSSSKLQPIPIWAIRAVLQPLAVVGRSPFTAWHWHASAIAFHMSVEKARTEIGWEPRYSNVDALEHGYREYLAGHAGASAHSAPLKGALARVLRG
jgi:nucleoside-diphosphate-sugar epimerase